MGSQLRADQYERYKRHLTLPEIGVRGQQALLEARVLLVGAGGLGCPLAQYLAAAGVGTLGIVDFDVVDASNLQRQVLYGSADVGRPKVEVAAERIAALNPDVRVEAQRLHLSSENALEILGGYDETMEDIRDRRSLRPSQLVEEHHVEPEARRPGQVSRERPQNGP